MPDQITHRPKRIRPQLPSKRRWGRLYERIKDVKFNRLTGIRFHNTHKSGTTWIFKCDCGKEVPLVCKYVVKGHTKSCGCLNLELIKTRSITHGRSGTTEHIIWGSMLIRCGNPKSGAYHNYGGRGISVCARWKHGEGGASGFECFLSDMGMRPSAKHQIERVDNNAGYSPENCKWATAWEQSRNRRNNHLIEIDGVVKCLTDWSHATGLTLCCIKRRLKSGWSERNAILTPRLK